MWNLFRSKKITMMLIFLTAAFIFLAYFAFSYTPRNVCGSTLTPQSGLPNKGSCVHLIRAWRMCSTTAFSSPPTAEEMASFWTRNVTSESTLSQSAKVFHVWRYASMSIFFVVTLITLVSRKYTICKCCQTTHNRNKCLLGYFALSKCTLPIRFHHVETLVSI